jgi:hypothetical protein
MATEAAFALVAMHGSLEASGVVTTGAGHRWLPSIESHVCQTAWRFSPEGHATGTAGTAAVPPDISLTASWQKVVLWRLQRWCRPHL